MNVPNIDATLYAACARIEAAVAAVSQRLIETLGAHKGNFASTAQRQAQTNAQFDLRRKQANFTLVFSDMLRQRVIEAARPPQARSRSLAMADLETLSLVAEDEVDERVAAEKFGVQLAQECEWELRELGGYIATLLQEREPDPQRNPLRPDTIGRALRRAIHATSDDPEARLTLEQEFGRALGAAMRACYATIVTDFQERGLRPTELMLRTVQGPGNDLPREMLRESSGYQTSGFNSSGFQASARDVAQAGQLLSAMFGIAMPPGLSAADILSQPAGLPGHAPTTTGGALPGRTSAPGAGSHDAQMREVLRQLSSLNLDVGALREAASSGRGSAAGMLGSRSGVPVSPSQPQPLSPPTAPITPLAGLMAVNVIRQHRDELMRASSGTLDHMVIDVVGALFDQVLSDKKVPPQMARQIARLQLPVLRAALKDVGFFSTRRHPVRRFVNRIASLAAAYEDLDQGPGKQFIEHVQALVQEIVEGDFDQMDLYESKLQAIEALIQQQSARDVGAQAPVAALIDGKATQLRIQQRYMRELTGKLQAVTLPDFVRDFLAQVWSQVQVQAAGPDGSAEFAQRAARAARELAMSVQPKGNLQGRKAFLMLLPQLMKDLNEGLALIRWPEEAKKSFFAQLLPRHAESLKIPPLTDFEQRQLKHQLDQVDKVGIPTPADLITSAETASSPAQEAVLTFTPEEVRQIGLVEEAAVDWDGKIDIDLEHAHPSNAPATPSAGGATAAADAGASDDVDIVIDAMAPEGSAPTHGPQLVRHLQTGIAYRMHLEGGWRRVRLNWISPGRGFFVFTHGKAHEKTISLTARMITRLCETERFRAFEQAELLERATARARKQLAHLGATHSQPSSLGTHA